MSSLTASLTAAVVGLAVLGAAFAQEPGAPRAVEPRTPEPGRSAVSTARPPALPDKPGETVTIRGKVLRPDGRPAAGAIVRAVKFTFRSYILEQTLLATFVAERDGQFQLSFEKPGMNEAGAQLSVWASLPGYGFAMLPMSSAGERAPIVLQLVEDEPIRGRIVNREGRPVPDARVDVSRYNDSTDEWIDRWLATMPANAAYTRIVVPEQPSDAAKSHPGEAILRIRSIQWLPAGFFPTVRTGFDGRFEIQGLGRNRLIALAITGTRIVATAAPVLTRPIKPIHFKTYETFGSHFECVVAPSVPVEGLVADAETGKPIPGAVVTHEAVALAENGRMRISNPSLTAFLFSKSDARGHYRLEGLETESKNFLRIVVPDLPYPGVHGLSVPPSVTPAPMRQDFKLKKGAWAVGRAYDIATGKPVFGTVSYTPFRSNEFARQYEHGRSVSDFQVALTDAQGRFRVPAIPGRGVLCLTCSSGDYRSDFGLAQIKELADWNSTRSGALPTVAMLLPGTFHALRAIDVRPGAAETAVDLPVDPGQNVLLKFVDAEGRRLSGVETSGLSNRRRNIPGGGRVFIEGDSATVVALSADEPRAVWLRQRATGLTRLIRLTPKPGEAERTVVLEPPAVVTGRLVSPGGAPLSELLLECALQTPPFASLPFVKPGSDGRFRYELPAGGPFRMRAGGSPNVTIAQDLTVAAAERIDLGEIIVAIEPNHPGSAKVRRGPEKRTRPQAEPKLSNSPHAGFRPTNGTPAKEPRRLAAADSKPAPSKEETAEAATVRGKVLRPDGRPAAGANVVLLRSFLTVRGTWSSAVVTATASVSGEFELPMPKHQADDARSSAATEIAAGAPGFGLQWTRLVGKPDLSRPIVLQLVPEFPIHGRVVDAEGKPVRDVRVRVLEQGEPQEGKDLGPWFEAVKSGNMLGQTRSLGKRLMTLDDEWQPAAATTGPDGRFVLPGLGPERLVTLELRGETIAYAQLDVVTRAMQPIARATRSGGGNPIFGADFTYQAQPTQPIVGTVREAGTHKPLAGLRIESRPPAAPQWGIFIATKTDAQGRYRLVGLPKRKSSRRFDRNDIGVIPDDTQPYFVSRRKVPDMPGLEPLTIDFELTRGLWIIGRVTDKATGQPITSRLSYYPFLSNSFARKALPSGDRVMTGDFYSFQDEQRYVTRSDGTFRLVGLPGPGIVTANAIPWASRPTALALGGVYRKGAGASEIPGMDEDGNFPTYRNVQQASSKRDDALREINPPPGSPAVVCNVVLDSGGALRIRAVDRDGRPVERCYISHTAAGSNMDRSGVSPGSTFDLTGLAPKELRVLIVCQPQRRIGKVLAVTYDEKSSHTVTTILEPCATVKGRLLGQNGAPLKFVRLLPIAKGAFGTLEWFGQAHSDADGRFVFDNLPPGCDYYSLHAEGTGFGFAPVVEKVVIAPGKTIDLGDVKVQHPK